MSDQGDNGSQSSGQDVGVSGSAVSTEAPAKGARRRHGSSATASGSRKIAHVGRKKSNSADEHGAPKKHGKLFLFFGVILPVLAMLFEITTHYCARHFFDPFPSASHVVLFSLIPLSNYLAWLAGRKDLSAHYGFMSLISGMALGIGCLYGLMFLPLTPMSCLFSLFFGFGLLGLAPLLAIPCTWLSGKSVCKLASNQKTFFDPHQVEHIGHLIVLCMVVAVELPSTLTRMNLSLAADPASAKQGVEWLRQYGSEEVMQRACYERSGRATDILGSLYESAHPVTVDQARTIFYYVTGKPFNSVPIPSSARATMQHAGNVDDIAGVNAKVQDEFDLDADIAGEAVSGVARGLSISDSTIRGKVDPDGAIADLNWAFTFKNVSAIDREARAKILLPPGAVVTKATLTVNGQEREATVMVRSEARAYYRQAIAEHKKDPLLVSMCGLDQLLVQCFLVQPNSTMMVKLSIAVPLTLDEKQKAVLVLPIFEERNFQFDVSDIIDLESTDSISVSGTASGVNRPTADKEVHFTAKVEPAQLGRFASSLTCDRHTNVEIAFCAATVAGNGSLIERRIRPQHYLKPERLTVLIDGSAAMENYKSEIVQALKGLPNFRDANIVLVGDDTTALSHFYSGTPDYSSALAQLEKFQFVGGHDDGTELIKALQSANLIGPHVLITIPGNRYNWTAETAGTSRLAVHDMWHNPPMVGTTGPGAVLWIHAAQPLSTVSSDAIKAQLQRVSSIPLLYDLQVVAGPDELLNDIEDNKLLVRIARVGSISEDVNSLYKAWAQSDETYATSPEYEVTTNAAPDLVNAHVTSASLAQLYAYDQILKDLQSNDSALVAQAHLLADRYHLITPISSAVVTDINVVPTPTPPAKEIDYVEAINNFDPLGVLRQAEQKAFNEVTSQLNCLSSAAVAPGGGVVNAVAPGGGVVNALAPLPSYQSYQSYQAPAKPDSVTLSTNAPNMENEQLKQSQAAPAAAPAAVPIPMAPAAAPMAKAPVVSRRKAQAYRTQVIEPSAGMAQRQTYSSSEAENGTAYLNKKMDFYRYPAAKEPRLAAVSGDANPDTAFNVRESYHKRFPFPKDAQSPASPRAAVGPSDSAQNIAQPAIVTIDASSVPESVPQLQGATNGTIGPMAKSEPHYARGATATDSGLVGAPVDPRYGQSNEVGQTEEKAETGFRALPQGIEIWLLVFIASLFLVFIVVVRRKS